jgi:hypothetical protein
MSSDVSLQIPSLSELPLTPDEWAMKEPFMVSLYFGE